MKSFSISPLILACFLLTGCSCQHLTVQSQYYSHEDLASFYVRTPDPQLNNPPVGQKLIISWRMFKEFKSYQHVSLQFIVRLRNREEIVKTICLNRSRGSYVYSIINDDFFSTGGILTYKVQLVGDGLILDEWRHQLWNELITFDSEN